MHASDNNFLFGFVFLLIISGLTGYYAGKKGRNPGAWFLIALFISALAPVILYFLSPLEDQEKELSNQSSNKLRAPSLTGESALKLADETPSSRKLWYYLDENHVQYGPVSVIALKELFDKGKLGLNSYVWSEGMPKWERLYDLNDLKEALHNAHPLF